MILQVGKPPITSSHPALSKTRSVPSKAPSLELIEDVPPGHRGHQKSMEICRVFFPRKLYIYMVNISKYMKIYLGGCWGVGLQEKNIGNSNFETYHIIPASSQGCCLNPKGWCFSAPQTSSIQHPLEDLGSHSHYVLLSCKAHKPLLLLLPPLRHGRF